MHLFPSVRIYLASFNLNHPTYMNMTIPQPLIDASTSLWCIHCNGVRELVKHKLFASADEALQFTETHIAQNLNYRYAETKNVNSDDESDLPDGSLVGLIWDAPSRSMTREEVLSSNSIFKKEWLKTPPNISDYEAAEKLGVKFVGRRVSNVHIMRVSRYIGYLRRSGELNDKTREIVELVKAYEDFNRA